MGDWKAIQRRYRERVAPDPDGAGGDEDNRQDEGIGRTVRDHMERIGHIMRDLAHRTPDASEADKQTWISELGWMQKFVAELDGPTMTNEWRRMHFHIELVIQVLLLGATVKHQSNLHEVLKTSLQVVLPGRLADEFWSSLVARPI